MNTIKKKGKIYQVMTIFIKYYIYLNFILHSNLFKEILKFNMYLVYVNKYLNLYLLYKSYIFTE